MKTDEVNTKSFPEVTYTNTLQSAFDIIKQGQNRKKAAMLKLSTVSCFSVFLFFFLFPTKSGWFQRGYENTVMTLIKRTCS